MNIKRTGLLMTAAAGMAAPAFAQNAVGSGVMVPPPPPQLRPAPPVAGMQPPRAPDNFRFRAPIGMQARYTYMSINGNREALKLTDEQQKRLEDVWSRSQAADMARNEKQMNARQELDKLAEADPADVPKLEAAIRAVQNAQTDAMIADVHLNEDLRKILTQEQRDQLKDLPPTLSTYGVPMRPPMAPPPGYGGFGSPPPPGAPGSPPPPAMPRTPPPPGAPGTPPPAQPAP